MCEIRFGIGSEVQNSITLPATLTTSEADIFVVKDQKYMMFNQYTIMGQVTLGGVTSATFFYYVSPDGGTTWYPISLYGTAGEMTQRPVKVDSATYATGGVSYFTDVIDLPATLAFKVTGTSSSATPLYGIWVGGRNK